MRSVLAWLLFVLLAPSASASEKEARSLLDRAIQAHGGTDALKKAAAFTATAKGTRHVAGREVAYTRKQQAKLPTQLRQEITLGERVATTVVLDGDKARQIEGGKTIDLKAPRLKELQAEADVLWLATLVPLTKQGVTLSLVKEAKVNGAEAAGLKAVRKGHADTMLYFDKQSGLLVKISRRATLAGKELEQEWVYSGHKSFGGVKRPTKEVQFLAGKKVAELTIGGWNQGAIR